MVKVAPEELEVWSDECEQLLAEWSEKSSCYRWLHARSEKKYRKRYYSFSIPVIILSTLTGVANAGLTSYVPEEAQKIGQAIIGGFDEDSKFNNSVSKIVKDDNFVKEDYLERVSSKDYIQKFNSGLLGETPGQLDLSQTRVFKESKDIYDFIGGDKLEWINNGSGSLPLNSLATDIFIRDEKCVVDLNPVNSEFTTIQNQMGTKELGILIGDYKVNQPKDSRVQKQGVMQTPLLETDNDKQAF